MIFIIYIITIIYIFLIGSFIYGFDNIEKFKTETSLENTKFSIVIPFRNESDNLPNLLQSLYLLNYSKHLYEILLVDDASEDNSVELITAFIANKSLDNITILQNNRVSHSPKKDALNTAIKKAKFDWIVTTDADCLLPEKWLQTLDSFIVHNSPEMIVAPVTYTITNSFLEHFQLHDFLSLQGATIAGFGLNKPFLCNGANLAYRKKFFNTLNGFEGNNTIASGDDIFLLEKAIKIGPEKVHYLKSTNAIVITKPQLSLALLIQQRVRWAAKTTAYNNTFGKLVGLSVLLMNAMIVTSFFLTLFGALNLFYFGFGLAIKLVIDFLLLYKTAHFFNQKASLKLYLFSGLLYPLFSVFVAVYSMFKDYKWKGRHFKA
jgi:cellulose synthase/poly-beta-1,6-N-acetylglucosamine synthase-like glycosyltransferase